MKRKSQQITYNGVVAGGNVESVVEAGVEIDGSVLATEVVGIGVVATGVVGREVVTMGVVGIVVAMGVVEGIEVAGIGVVAAGVVTVGVVVGGLKEVVAVEGGSAVVVSGGIVWVVGPCVGVELGGKVWGMVVVKNVGGGDVSENLFWMKDIFQANNAKLRLNLQFWLISKWTISKISKVI